MPWYDKYKQTSDNTAVQIPLPTGKSIVTNTSPYTPEQFFNILDQTHAKQQYDEQQEKHRISQRKNAEQVIADPKKSFTLPDGSSKAYKDMGFREKKYVQGTALENRGRIFPDEESFIDTINPLNWIGSMAGNMSKAPYEAEQSNSNMPYLTALAEPLLMGRVLGSGTINPFSKKMWTNSISDASFVNSLGMGVPGLLEKGVNKVVQSTESGLLSNAYKLNPNAFKPNPNNFYRQVDAPTFNEGLESGLIRGKQDIGYSDESAMKMFGDDAYYNKGRLYYKNEKDYPYLFEANLPEDRFIPKVNGRTRKYTTENTRVRVSKEPLPINDPNIKTYKKDWLQGYKPIEIPKKGFNSEINWGKWNKEIPDNPQLMKEYNAIDYRKNPLSDKEKEMYQWFDEQMRFDKLPETTNKQSIEVLDNFKQRIKTPEGQKRLKELGITEEQLLQDLKIVEDPNTYGYYRGLNKNTIAINPNHPLPKKVVRHEIEHGVQNALRKSKINKAIDGTPAEKLKALEINTTEIDDILSELTLRREGTPNKVWNKINTNETVNINDYKSLINNKQNATDYFLTGSDGAEKSAFLGEVQQYMMDAGKIPKNSYVQITPEMVKETMVDAMFDEKTGGKYLRLFNIIKADPKNYEIISKGLNKMLSITPLIGAGAYMQNKEYKNGGQINNWTDKYKN